MIGFTCLSQSIGIAAGDFLAGPQDGATVFGQHLDRRVADAGAWAQYQQA